LTRRWRVTIATFARKMGSFGGFYSGEKKRSKKEDLEIKARQLSYQKPFVLPKVQIISKTKKEE